MLRISDFVDMEKFEEIMSNWAKATGLATVAVDADGNYISQCYNFTDFCIKYTRGSEKGRERCERCDRECHGIYHCHAGLIDFSIDLIIEDQKVGSVIGGQVLPEKPDETQFRCVARELGVDEDEYIQALYQVNVRTEETIHASALLLGQVLNHFINAEYSQKENAKLIASLSSNVEEANKLIQEIEDSSKKLQSIQSQQRILALNASIEAARAGEAGAGFSVVAKEFGKLSENSAKVNSQIETITSSIVKLLLS